MPSTLVLCQGNANRWTHFGGPNCWGEWSLPLQLFVFRSGVFSQQVRSCERIENVFVDCVVTAENGNNMTKLGKIDDRPVPAYRRRWKRWWPKRPTEAVLSVLNHSTDQLLQFTALCVGCGRIRLPTKIGKDLKTRSRSSLRSSYWKVLLAVTLMSYLAVNYLIVDRRAVSVKLP